MPFLFFLLFTDLSVYFGTTSSHIKIGTFANINNRIGSSEIIFLFADFLATMLGSDFGTKFSVLKNSSEIIYALHFHAFNFHSKEFQNTDFTRFSKI